MFKDISDFPFKEKLLHIFSKVVKKGDFILSSGLKSDFYIDAKSVLLQSKTLDAISRCILYMTRDINYSLVAGMTTGSDPIVCSCVALNYTNGLFIRNKQKDYGTKKLIEGQFRENEKVLIVDDVLTTGKSLKYVYDVLIENKLIPTGIVVLIDREENDALNYIKEYTKIPVESLITKYELFQYLGLLNNIG